MSTILLAYCGHAPIRQGTARGARDCLGMHYLAIRLTGTKLNWPQVLMVES